MTTTLQEETNNVQQTTEVKENVETIEVKENVETTNEETPSVEE